ncbi:MAG: LrgB family protein, partial [Anaerovoracaceae bacterium]|nr:LrgB family protein [Anaerovoracaceae bacterium]
MNNFVTFLSENAYFGVFLTVGFYLLFRRLSEKVRFPLFNPILLTVAAIIGFLVLFHIPYEAYVPSGDMITWFLTPATVCFAIPLYRQLHVLRRHMAAILISIFTGSLASVASIFIMGKLFGLPAHIHASLSPKSVTTPIATAIAEEMGGVVG